MQTLAYTPEKFQFALKHFVVSALVLAMLVVLVVTSWYPTDFFKLEDAWQPLKILLLVDVIIGPFLAYVVFSATKPLKTLVMNMTFIVGVQIAALIAGAYTLYSSRPVALVYYNTAFYVITQTMIEQDSLSQETFEQFPEFGGVPLVVQVDANAKFLEPTSFKSLSDGADVVLGKNRQVLRYVQEDAHRKATYDAFFTTHGVEPSNVEFFPLYTRGDSYMLAISRSEKTAIAPLYVKYTFPSDLPFDATGTLSSKYRAPPSTAVETDEGGDVEVEESTPLQSEPPMDDSASGEAGIDDGVVTEPTMDKADAGQ